MSTVTVFILTKNEEELLPACLARVGWADEVLVVDSGSTDRTQQIARDAGARVVEHPFTDFSTQYNFGLNESRSEWAMQVDADEMVTPELRDSVLAAVRGDDGKTDVWALERDAYVFGHRMRATSWSHEWIPRLFRRGCARYTGEVHPILELGGRKVERLRGILLHYTYRSVVQYFQKDESYSTFWAQKAYEKGRRTGLANAFFSSVWRFFHNYFIRGEIWDGYIGLMLALLAAEHTFIRHIKLWGMEHADEIRRIPEDPQ